MSAIPKAQDFVRDQEQKISEAERNERQRKQLARLDAASDEMADALTEMFNSQISKAVSSASYSNRVDVRLQKLGIYKGIPGDVLLYGHRENNSWYQRTDLGLELTVFERLQSRYYANGWYLIEESDPSRSRNFVFALYPQKPSDKHAFFNQEKRVWHKNNMFDEQKLAHQKRDDTYKLFPISSVGERI